MRSNRGLVKELKAPLAISRRAKPTQKKNTKKKKKKKGGTVCFTFSACFIQLITTDTSLLRCAFLQQKNPLNPLKTEGPSFNLFIFVEVLLIIDSKQALQA